MIATLSLIGLFLDLVGAFLLSIPMVWNVGAACQRLQRAEKWIQNIRRYVTCWRHSPSSDVIMTIIGCFSILWLVGFVITIVRVLFTDFEAIWLDIGCALIILVIAFFGSIHMVFIALSEVVSSLASFTNWIIRDEPIREKRVGQVGLVLLCLGFTCQAIVHFLSTTPNR